MNKRITSTLASCFSISENPSISDFISVGKIQGLDDMGLQRLIEYGVPLVKGWTPQDKKKKKDNKGGK